MQQATRVRAGQLVVAEGAVAAVVVAAFGPRWVLIGIGALAAAVLVATFGRAGGRWWYEAVASQLRFRRRRRLAAGQVLAAAVGSERGSAPSSVASHSRAYVGAPLGAGRYHHGRCRHRSGRLVRRGRGRLNLGGRPGTTGKRTSAEPVGARSGRIWGRGPVPLAELASLVEPEPDRAAVSCVQVILAPGVSAVEPRPTWVAVRVTPTDALAAERSGGVTAIERRVAAAALRAARTLDGHGWPARAAGADGLLGVLVEATGLDGPPQEHWSVWRSGRLVRTHYVVTGWTAAHGTVVPGVTQVAVSFTRRGDPVVLAAVASQPAALARVCRNFVAACAAAGVRTRRLDGEQAPAAYATAPTAVPMAPVRGTGPGRISTASVV